MDNPIEVALREVRTERTQLNTHLNEGKRPELTVEHLRHCWVYLNDITDYSQSGPWWVGVISTPFATLLRTIIIALFLKYDFPQKKCPSLVL